MLKKLISIISIASILGVSNVQAASSRPYYHMRPMPVHYVNHNEYHRGYDNGKRDERERVIKTVAAVALIATSAIVIYELAKPSNNIEGHVQLAQF